MEPKKYPPYLFDVDFDALSLPPEPEIAEEAPPPPTFSEAELEAARSAAFEAGKAEGLAEAGSGFEKQIETALTVLQGEFAAVRAAQSEANDETLRDAVKVATTIARKLFPEFTRREGLEEIEAFVQATISTLFAEAEVIVRTPEPLTDELRARLAPIAAASGLGDNLEVAPDASLGPADCRISWGNGGAERNGAQLLGDIDALVARFLDHLDAAPQDDAISDNAPAAPEPETMEDAAPVEEPGTPFAAETVETSQPEPTETHQSTEQTPDEAEPAVPETAPQSEDPGDTPAPDAATPIMPTVEAPLPPLEEETKDNAGAAPVGLPGAIDAPGQTQGE